MGFNWLNTEFVFHSCSTYDGSETGCFKWLTTNQSGSSKAIGLNYSLEKWLSFFNHIVVVVACLYTQPHFQLSLYLMPSGVCVFNFSRKFRIIIHSPNPARLQRERKDLKLYFWLDLEDEIVAHTNEPGLELIGDSQVGSHPWWWPIFCTCSRLPSRRLLMFSGKTAIIILHN